MSCCWKWVEGFYKSESDITKDLLENEEPCDVVSSEQVMCREEEALSGKEVHFAIVEEHPTTVEEDHPTTVEEHHIDGVIGEDGTGSDTETEIDYDDDIFEEADSDYEQLPEQQELAAAGQELAAAEQELAAEKESLVEQDFNSVNSSNAETIAGFVM